MITNGTHVEILMDTGASKSFMSKTYYMNNPCLHKHPKFASRAKSIIVGNGMLVPILFVIPVIVTINGHRFEIYTLVSEIHDNIDLVIGLKNMYELEANFCTRDSTTKFLNRSAPMFPTKPCQLNPGDKRLLELDIPFCEELSGLAIVKVTRKDQVSSVKLKITRNRALLDVTNSSNKVIEFDPNIAIGEVDLRSLGYYRIPHGALQENLSPKYKFESLYRLCDQYNECVNKANTVHRKQLARQEHSDPYPWLDKDDDRRHMSDAEILESAIDLTKSKLSHSQKHTLIGLTKRYRKAFSLRDEIGECPNISIDIDVIDKSPFFVRPFPLSEVDKPFMDKQMKRLVSLGILSRNSTSHTSPVMLITRKVTKDKRPVVDFRLLNSRILRKNTASPLMKDIFNILGNSKCDVMSCVDIKDAFHSIKLAPASKEYCGIMPYFGSPHYRYEVLPMGLSISPAKWMEYVNVLLDKITDRANYIAIMDDLLVHSKQKDHMEKLETHSYS